MVEMRRLAWRAVGITMFRGMSKYAGEQVLVVPRALFDQIGAFEGIKTEGWMPRSGVAGSPEPLFHRPGRAEEDPSHKQLIPYCVFRCGDRIFHYTRGKSGGESRLHAKISVGVGGHVNPVDMDGGKTGPDAYHAAVTREIEEELDLPEAHSTASSPCSTTIRIPSVRSISASCTWWI